MIGKPLPGVHIAVVGPDLLPVPYGQAGELLVGGVGVAHGYHRRPEKTREMFLRSVAKVHEREGDNVVHIPGLEPGHRVVRTRDRVVQPKAGGPLFWLGKLDGEVCSSAPFSNFSATASCRVVPYSALCRLHGDLVTLT